MNIFKKENIKIRSFFAPNHTYDFNTFKALKANNIINVIDGYGLLPYHEFGINFIPQLFYKEIMLTLWNSKHSNTFELHKEKKF